MPPGADAFLLLHFFSLLLPHCQKFRSHDEVIDVEARCLLVFTFAAQRPVDCTPDGTISRHRCRGKIPRGVFEQLIDLQRLKRRSRTVRAEALRWHQRPLKRTIHFSLLPHFTSSGAGFSTSCTYPSLCLWGAARRELCHS